MAACRTGTCRCSASSAADARGRRVRRQPCRQPAAVRELSIRRRRTTRPARSRCSHAGRLRRYSDITYAFDGGRSEYRAPADEIRVAHARADLSFLNAFTWSRAMDNGAASLENANGNFPAPQDFYNLEAEWSTSGYDQPYNSTTSVVWGLPFGRGHMFGADVSTPMDMLIGGWQLAGINTITSGVPVTFIYTPATPFIVSGIAQDFRGANNYRPNIVCEPTSADAVDHRVLQPELRRRSHRSEPAVSATRRATASGRRGSGSSTWRSASSWRSRPPRRSKCASKPSTCSTGRTSRRRMAIAAPAAFGTITGTYDARQLQLGVKLLW